MKDVRATFECLNAEFGKEFVEMHQAILAALILSTRLKTSCDELVHAIDNIDYLNIEP